MNKKQQAKVSQASKPACFLAVIVSRAGLEDCDTLGSCPLPKTEMRPFVDPLANKS